MRSICNEIFNFLSEISKKELKRNPQLRSEVWVLLGRLERMKLRQHKSGSREMAKYLNKEMLETK
ncbi:MAG TPA: hypothetical protein DCY86_10805 [Bdellovibrionales bacterium]|nr:hypothetical protein [Bdellovibrionales bacterium]